jgi:hypothetical protein
LLIKEFLRELEKTCALAMVALCVVEFIPTTIKADKIPIIAITTSNSISVNA